MYRANRPIYRCAPGRITGQYDVSFAPRIQEWLLRMPKTHTLEASPKRNDVDRKIRQINEKSRGTHGSPRTCAALHVEDIRVGENDTTRLMRGVSHRKRPSTTIRCDSGRPAPGLVDRDFPAAEPDELWAARITHVPTQVGHLYLAVAVGTYGRKVVDWEMPNHLHLELVSMVGERGPAAPSDPPLIRNL